MGLKRVLIAFSGARENAIGYKLLEDFTLNRNVSVSVLGQRVNPSLLYIAKVTGGQYVRGNPNDPAALVSAAKATRSDVVIIGNEDPMAAGGVDALLAEKIPTFGHRKAVARLEWDKAWPVELAEKYDLKDHIPKSQVFIYGQGKQAVEYLHDMKEEGAEPVIKYRGLKGGKGTWMLDQLGGWQGAERKVIELTTNFREYPLTGVVIQDRVHGQEFSLQCLVSGETVIGTPAVTDHKRGGAPVPGIFGVTEGEVGVMTGGMGSISLANGLLPWVSRDAYNKTLDIVKDFAKAAAAETGIDCTGVIYAGAIMTKNGPVILEFNSRFGDTEGENIHLVMEPDYSYADSVVMATVEGTLSASALSFTPLDTVVKPGAGEPYVIPGAAFPSSGVALMADEAQIRAEGGEFWWAGVNYTPADGKIVMASSTRAFAIGAAAKGVEVADFIVENAFKHVRAEGGNIWHRRDIGEQTLELRTNKWRELTNAKDDS